MCGKALTTGALLGMLLLGLRYVPTACGQSALGQLEQRLEGAPPSRPGLSDSPPPAAAGTGYLGAVLDDAPAPKKGVVVQSVRPGGPADQGGLRPGDVIVQLESKPVNDLTDVDWVLDRAAPGQTLQMIVERKGQTTLLKVTLGSRPSPPAENTAPALLPPASPALPPAGPASSPPSPPAASSSSPAARRSSDELPPPVPSGSPPATSAGTPTDPGAARGPGSAALGITVVTLTDEARMTYGIPVARGALITGVRPGSPADQAGLPLGGVIVGIDGRRVDSSDDLVAAIRAARPGQAVELMYFEGNRLTRKEIRLAAASGPTLPGVPLGPGSGASTESGPPRSVLGGSGSRPLLGRVERMVEGLARPGGISPAGPSTVYDPLAMAELQQKVAELTAEVAALKDRLKALEERLGGQGGGASPVPGGAPPAPGGTPTTPSIQPPAALPPRTPSFETQDPPLQGVP